jgi:protein gp37
MPGKSSIAWCDRTWNVGLLGCTPTSEGPLGECSNCYARALHNRFAQAEKPLIDYATDFEIVRRMNPLRPGRDGVTPGVFTPEHWFKRLYWPLHVTTPSLVFANSMTDLFHGALTEEDIQEALDVMGAADWHYFQILTKRDGRLAQMGRRLRWPRNVAMGVSIGHHHYNHRAANLRRGTPDHITRFVSFEPLISDVTQSGSGLDLRDIHWAIVGAESGNPQVIRPMDLDWVRNIEDLCRWHNVSFFFKQTTDPATGKKTQLPPLDGKVYAEYPPLITRWQQLVQEGLIKPPSHKDRAAREAELRARYYTGTPVVTQEVLV